MSAGHFRVVADGRLVPLRVEHLEGFELEFFRPASSWKAQDRALRLNDWVVSMRASFSSCGPSAQVVERWQLEALLDWSSAVRPLAWALERIVDGRVCGIATVASSAPRTCHWAIVVTEAAPPFEFSSYLDPVPAPDSIRLLASDCGAQAHQAIRDGLAVSSAVEALLEFLEGVDPATAARLALTQLRLPSTLARVEPLLTIEAIRSHRALFEDRLRRAYEFFVLRSRKRP